MHIGLCSPHWPPAKGANGIVSYVGAVREYFVSRGHLVSVISNKHMYSSDGSETPLGQVGPSNGRFGQFVEAIGHRFTPQPGALPGVGRAVAREIAEAHRTKPFDILEMEESFGWSDLVRRAVDVPVVTRLHGPHFLKPFGVRSSTELRSDKVRCKAEAGAMRSADLITAPTRAIMDSCRTESARDGRKPALVIANPIVMKEGSRQWRLADCERDHILSIGRFDYAKGADTLLAAFGRLLERRPTAKLTMVGPDVGIEVSSNTTLGFEEYARTHLSPEARARVRFAGFLRPDEIAPLRLMANVTIVASRSETFSYILVEGMAAGTPLISTDWPGSDEVLVPGQTGLLTPVGEPEAMARTLEWVLDHPEEAAAMGAAGNARCFRCFRAEVIGDRLLECYEEMIEAA